MTDSRRHLPVTGAVGRLSHVDVQVPVVVQTQRQRWVACDRTFEHIERIVGVIPVIQSMEADLGHTDGGIIRNAHLVSRGGRQRLGRAVMSHLRIQITTLGILVA